VQAAHRVLATHLQMTDAEIVFDFTKMETCEEDTDSPSYPGIRSVYNKTFIEGAVTTKDPVVLRRIGIEGTSELQVTDKTKVERHYQWFTEDQCLERHVKLRVLGKTHDTSALVRAPLGFKDEDMLAYHLTECGIDVSKFGQQGTKTLGEFADELATGDSSLEKRGDGSLLRVVDIVALKIIKETTGEVLIHSTRVSDGSVRKMDGLPHMRHRPDECQFLTAWYLVDRICRLDECYILLKKDVKVAEELKDNPAYPGMSTKHRRRTITGTLFPGRPDFEVVRSALPIAEEESWQQPSCPTPAW